MNDWFLDGIKPFMSYRYCHENGCRQADDGEGIDEFGKKDGVKSGF